MRLEARERQEFPAPTRSEGRRAWSRRNRTCGRNQAQQHLDFWLMATRTVRESVLLSSAPSALTVSSLTAARCSFCRLALSNISASRFTHGEPTSLCRHSLGALAWVSTFEFLVYFVCTADIVGFLPVCPWHSDSPLVDKCSNHNSFRELSLALGTCLVCMWDREQAPRGYPATSGR